MVLAVEEVDVRLFESISETLPPGGRIFVVYIGHGETEEGLQKGVPPPVTPIGYLLWRAGCVWFKDWYFVEGFWEEDMKLQGEKPWDQESRRREMLRVYEELSEFMRREKREEQIFESAK